MRLFIAIELPDNLKEEIASIQSKLKSSSADVKWVDCNNIHLTLKFLGNADCDKISKLNTLLDKTAASYKKFESDIFRLGAFPKIEYPRVIWIGINKNCSLIEEIEDKIDEGCFRIGFKREERSFSAHLTIGRVRSGKNKQALKQSLISQEISSRIFTVEKLVLFKSTLTPKGPVYTALHTATFA